MTALRSLTLYFNNYIVVMTATAFSIC
jgi:hypothetical protein